jgi:hypothetical protein
MSRTTHPERIQAMKRTGILVMAAFIGVLGFGAAQQSAVEAPAGFDTPTLAQDHGSQSVSRKTSRRTLSRLVAGSAKQGGGSHHVICADRRVLRRIRFATWARRSRV